MDFKLNSDFEFFIQFNKRLKRASEDSDSALFNDLLLAGEMLTKIIGAGLVAGLKKDKDRNRYRFEYQLVRADSIGGWAEVISKVTESGMAQFLCQPIRERELVELSHKGSEGSWQYSAMAQLKECARLLKVSEVQEIPRKYALKNWFFDFATIRNKTRGHGAITATQKSEAIIPLFKSLNLIIENYSLFARPWVFLYQNFSGKYRISRIAGDIAPFNELKSSTEFKNKYRNGIHVFFDCITRIKLVNSNPELEDLYLPNGNFKLAQYEHISYLTGDRKKVSGKDYLTPHEILPKSETEGIGQLEVQGNSFGNIPPIIENYVTRSYLEDEVERVLIEDGRYPIVTLVGKGGIGKTSLALKVLHKLSEEGTFEVILWFSARDIDLMAHGAKTVRPQVLTIEDIAKEFCDLLEVEVNKKTKTAEQELISCMSNSDGNGFGRVLFVFDNFETVSDPVELFRWIDTYIRLPNKVLITSRESRDFKADFPIEVFGMNHSECLTLIHTTSNQLGIKDLLTSKYIDDLVEESEGHPYIIKILLGEVAKTKVIPKKIERIVAGREDILLALFRRTYDKLSTSAKRVFLTLCSWRSTVPQIALEAVLLRPENEERIDVESAVEELRRSSFIHVSRSAEDNAFITVPLAASIFGKAEYEVSPRKISIEADRDLLREFGASKDLDLKNSLLPRIERKFKAISRQIKSKKSEEEQKAYLATHLPTLEYLSRRYPYGWIMLSELYRDLDDKEGFLSSLKNFLKEKGISTDDKRLAWNDIAKVYREAGDWEGESQALSEICSIYDTEFQEVSDVANRMNNYFKDNKNVDLEYKTLAIKRVAEVMERRIEEEGYATDFSRLAWLFLNIKETQKALSYAEQGLERDTDNLHCFKLVDRLRRDL